MTTAIHACVDRVLPSELQSEADLVALEENPANRPVADSPFEIAAVKHKMWHPGRTLRVRFLDGDPAVQRKVEQVAQQWCEHANIQLAFGQDPDAEIRISFLQPGSWSYIGTDALLISPEQPTMNYGWLQPDTDDEEYSRVVLHEFGHALGCIHEHQNPSGGIPWNEAAVLHYYMGPPNNWSEAQVRENVLKTYDKASTNYTQFDAHSIMLYPVPAEHTTDGTGIPWQNSVLSDSDKSFIAQMYPRSAQG